ncbi:immunoglobulin-like domain-containing protein [Aquimarina sp. M1]
MKKIYKYIVSGIILLCIGIACTKEITDDLVVFFKVEFNETTLETFVNTREESQFTIIGGTEINEGDYQIKYNVTEGAGSYSVNNVAIVENEFVELPEGPEYTIEYLGTVVGTNKVTITIKDQSNREEEFVLTYNVKDTDFSFDVIPSPENTYVDGEIDLNLSISEINTATYTVAYEFGSPDTDIIGVGNIKIEDDLIEPNTTVEVPAGDTIWNFEGVTVGTVEVIFRATSSLGITKEKIILIEVTETPDFTFSATTEVSEVLTNSAVEITFTLEETVGSSNYTMLFTANKPGTIEYNGVTYIEDSEIPLEVGVTTGVYSGSVSGTNELRFEVTNANTIPVTKTANITLELIAPDTEAPVINLNGPEIHFIDVFDSYVETASASDNVDGDLTDQIVFGGDFVDTDILGSFIRTYNVTDSSGNVAEEELKTIVVEDNLIPVITLIGNGLITLDIGDTYIDQGATAQDNYDGNISSDIVVTSNVNTQVSGSYQVTYNVTDSSGNQAIEVVRVVTVVNPDTTPPVITLNGTTPVISLLNNTYMDQGATAFDNVDGDITSNIQTSSNVNVNVIGTYQVRYNVQDNAGNEAIEVVRIVNVVQLTENCDCPPGEVACEPFPICNCIDPQTEGCP